MFITDQIFSHKQPHFLFRTTLYLHFTDEQTGWEVKPQRVAKWRAQDKQVVIYEGWISGDSEEGDSLSTNILPLTSLWITSASLLEVKRSLNLELSLGELTQ